MAIVIDDAFEGSSVKVASSTVVGSGNAAVVTFVPRTQVSEVSATLARWLAIKVRVTGVNGIRPTFKWTGLANGAGGWWGSTASGIWESTRRMLFSYDLVTWTPFDTAHTVTSSDVTFRHSTPFTADVVYISHNPIMTPTMVRSWLTTLQATCPALITDTWSSANLQSGAFKPQTDELGRTVPAQPHLAFLVRDPTLPPSSGRCKRALVLLGMVHAGEDQGCWALRGAVEYLLGATDQAINLRAHFDTWVYPTLNAPGRAGGHWRGSFESKSGADDLNRHFTDAVPPIDIVATPRAAMQADLPSAVHVVLDFHGAIHQTFGAYPTTSVNDQLLFNAVTSYMPGWTVTALASGVASDTTTWVHNTYGATFYDSPESGHPIPVTTEQLKAFGAAHMRALADLTVGGQVPTRVTACVRGTPGA